MAFNIEVSEATEQESCCGCDATGGYSVRILDHGPADDPLRGLWCEGCLLEKLASGVWAIAHQPTAKIFHKKLRRPRLL